MAANDTTIDIGLLLETIRAEVKAQRSDVAGAEPHPLEQQLARCIEQVEIARVVSAHWPLEGRTLVERGWIMLHKVVRRGLRWYINPIVEQQNAFNDASARALHVLAEAYRALQGQIDQERLLVAADRSNHVPPAR